MDTIGVYMAGLFLILSIILIIVVELYENKMAKERIDKLRAFNRRDSINSSSEMSD